MIRSVVALGVVCVLGSISSAAVVYEPVQYQYGYQPRYYYGGSNPAVFAAGERLHCFWNQGYSGGSVGFSYAKEGRFGVNLVHYGLIGQPSYVYSDCLPAGVIASVYGFTDTDARNEAYANVPRYFVKKDLLRAAVSDGDGNLVVPAQARPVPSIEIKPYVGPTTQPTTEPILIIPKRLLQQPLKPANRSVADAR